VLPQALRDTQALVHTRDAHVLVHTVMPLQVLAFVLRSKRQQFARAWQSGREDGNMEEEGVAALRPNDSL